MDQKNESDLDMTMEPKCQYKLRSSLKKTKLRTPLGSLDISEMTVDTTIIPPPRRVSFAASNYVKPFMDDPEKNTIWDNTYEEEVNHTDSTKSENTNHTNMSELKSHYQETKNIDPHQSKLRDELPATNIPNLNRSMRINDDVRIVSCDGNLDITSSIPAYIDVKSNTELFNETTFPMEFTCQWKNKIIESSISLQNEVTTQKDNLLRNFTIHQEEDMSMTGCLGSNPVPHNILEAKNQFELIESNFLALPIVNENAQNKENIPIITCKEKSFLLDQSEMKFTCAIPNNILQTTRSYKETGSDSIVMANSGENKENVPAGKEGCLSAVHTKIPEVSSLDQSEMEFTCKFPNNVLETTNSFKGARLLSKAIDENLENKVNLFLPAAKVGCAPADYAKNEKVSVLDQSEMEWTYAFSDNLLEAGTSFKGAKSNALVMNSKSQNVENKENILSCSKAKCVPTSFAKNEKVSVLDQSDMEFTCAFPDNLLQAGTSFKGAKSNALVMNAKSQNVDNKENILSCSKAKCVPTSFAKNEKVSVLDQSEMEFTCAFPDNLLEAGTSFKGAKSNALVMNSKSQNVENKENLLSCSKAKCVPTSFAKNEKVSVLDQSEMEFTCAFPDNLLQAGTSFKGAKSNALVMNSKSQNVENKENILSCSKAKCVPTSFAKNEKVSVLDQSEMEFTCAFPDNLLQAGTSFKGAKSNALVMNSKSQNVENKENILSCSKAKCVPTSLAKNENVSLLDQSEMEFTCAFPTNLFETSKKSKEKGDNSGDTTVKDENPEYKKKTLIFDDQVKCVLKFDTDEDVKKVDQDGIEFYNKLIYSVGGPNLLKDNSLAMLGVSKNVETQENMFPGNGKQEAFLSHQSEMKFNCKSSNKISGTVNQLQETKSDFIITTVVNEQTDNKENVILCNPACVKNEKVSLPDQSGRILFNTLNECVKMETNSVAMPIVTENAQIKENIPTVGLPTDHDKKAKIVAVSQSDLKMSRPFLDKISASANKLNETENNSLARLVTSTDVRNSNSILPIVCPISSSDEKENILSDKNESFDTKNQATRDSSPCSKTNIDNSKITLTSEFNTSKHVARITQCSMNQLTINEVNPPAERVYSNLQKSKAGEEQNLTVNISCSNNTYNTVSVKNNSKYKSQLNQGYDTGQNIPPPGTKNKVNTDQVKPMKVREFGNIFIAVDVTDVSIDHTINEHNTSVNYSSTQDYHPKENTYTCVAQPEKTVVGTKANKNPILDSVELQRSPTSFNKNGVNNIMQRSASANSTGAQSLHSTNIPEDQIKQSKQKEINLKKTSEFISNVVPDPLIIPEENFSKKLPESKEFTKNISSQNNGVEIETTKYLITEECSLIDIEESILINSITSPDEEAQTNVDNNFSQMEIQDGINLANPIYEHEEHAETKNPVTKVIYSEPMKVKPLSDEFPSLQSSGMNPFNFSSTASMEDTQQLIQATFTKPSFSQTEQFENDRWHSGFFPESKVLDGNKDESNVTNVTSPENETLKAETVLQNIKNTLVRGKYESIEYPDIVNSIKTHQELNNKMRKLLSNYRFPEIRTFHLQEETRKLSLANISSGENSSDRFVEVVDSAEDNNCNKSILLEHPKSLHEKIVDVCSRSNQLLNIIYHDEMHYIFTTMYELLMIYVHVHPEDGRVINIRTASSLKDSADAVLHFLIKKIIEKLRDSTLKSYLGPYYDVLSLLDHICLTTDEVAEFNYEFFSLQKLYPTLRINSDYSITFEILHTGPPIWWTIRVEMTSVNKINPETLQLESKWGSINEEHIKQILRNLDEGVDSLGNFISDVFKYFERTQLRYKVHRAQ